MVAPAKRRMLDEMNPPLHPILLFRFCSCSAMSRPWSIGWSNIMQPGHPQQSRGAAPLPKKNRARPQGGPFVVRSPGKHGETANHAPRGPGQSRSGDG